jgi:thermostable 8-oxoguanine DNA glycosylase
VNCQLPSTVKLKTLILNKSPELTNYFNSNHYRFYVNRNNTFIIHTSIYYTFDRKLDNFNQDHLGNERIYYFDGEMFFVNI